MPRPPAHERQGPQRGQEAGRMYRLTRKRSCLRPPGPPVKEGRKEGAEGVCGEREWPYL